MGAFPIFCKSWQQIFMAISELITHPLPLPRGEYTYSPLGRGKGWVLIMNTLEVSLHEFTPIQVEYPPTAFFFTKNRECSPLYAATKKANELMAHTYSSLYNIPCTGLRFFTVYGPWGRPDMALFIFTKAILEGRPIDVFNYGKMQRDFTYIDDIIEGVIKVMDKIPEPNPKWNGDNPDSATSYAPYKLYNIGNNNPVELMHFIEILESYLGKKTKKNLLPIQQGDVPATYADIEDLINDVDFKPSTTIEEGIKRFIEWYKCYNNV